ncbi:hypothetical protein F4X33_13175 [Candidatus Poribacteria bacterium]|nr:hypothetical protein [Candidatus Poribacteria bacterium]
MSAFQGFNVTGIDPNKYPVFTDDNDMRYDLFYLTLEPVGADADYENQRLWDYCFRYEVENWNTMGWAHRDSALPKLRFIFDADDNAFISASGEPLRTLESCLSYIKQLIERVNYRFISEVENVNRFREDIKQINASFSRK